MLLRGSVTVECSGVVGELVGTPGMAYFVGEDRALGVNGLRTIDLYAKSLVIAARVPKSEKCRTFFPHG